MNEAQSGGPDVGAGRTGDRGQGGRSRMNEAQSGGPDVGAGRTGDRGQEDIAA